MLKHHCNARCTHARGNCQRRIASPVNLDQATTPVRAHGPAVRLDAALGKVMADNSVIDDVLPEIKRRQSEQD